MAVEALIGPRTSAILATHVWGRTCDVEALAEVAERHGLRVLYDAAHAFGCDRAGRPVGTFGDAEVFSFHATKFVNAFEGGAITTDDDGIAERARRLRNFGFAGTGRTVSTGTNGKMHEASAAMGITSLEALDEIVAVNAAHETSYRRDLAGIEGLIVLPPDDQGGCNKQHVVIRIDRDVAPIERDVLASVLWAEGVRARRYFHPGCHRSAPYADRPSTHPLPLPHTERASAETLVLPTGTAVSEEGIEAICDLVRFAFAHASEIEERSGDVLRSVPTF
jgi:dTDP-4-amino-4,6-dideoxygalactose transaminase